MINRWDCGFLDHPT